MDLKEVIEDKTLLFSSEIVMLYNTLLEANQSDIAEELLKKGSGVTINVYEAIQVNLRKDFQIKLLSAYKDAQEARNLLNFIKMYQLSSCSVEKNIIDITEIIEMINALRKGKKYIPESDPIKHTN